VIAIRSSYIYCCVLKYLSISVLGQIKLVAFKNQNKKQSNEPDYIGNGIAIWVNEKKAGDKVDSEKL